MGCMVAACAPTATDPDAAGAAGVDAGPDGGTGPVDAGPPPTAPAITWAQPVSGEWLTLTAVAMDGAENAYILGSDNGGGPVVFDDGTELDDGDPATGASFSFLVSLAPDGTRRWSRALERGGLEDVGYVIVDETSVYVAYWSASDGTTATMALSAFRTSDGAPLWSHTLSADGVRPGGLATYGGQLYLAGSFAAPIDFGATTLSPLPPSAAGRDDDLFVAVLDAGGTFVRAAAFGGKPGSGARVMADEADGLAVSSSGVYVVGQVAGTMDLGAAGTVAPADEADGLLLALTHELSPRWGHHFDDVGSPSSATERVNALASSGRGVCVGGAANLPIDLGGGPRGSGSGAFIGCFEADGTHAWSDSPEGLHGPGEMVLDGAGNLLLSATVVGSDAATTFLPPIPSTIGTELAGLLASYDPEGRLRWWTTTYDPLSGPGLVYMPSIAAAPDGTVVLVATIEGERRFGGRDLSALHHGAVIWFEP